jgi:hypothetical protein
MFIHAWKVFTFLSVTKLFSSVIRKQVPTQSWPFSANTCQQQVMQFPHVFSPVCLAEHCTWAWPEHEQVSADLEPANYDPFCLPSSLGETLPPHFYETM